MSHSVRALIPLKSLIKEVIDNLGIGSENLKFLSSSTIYEDNNGAKAHFCQVSLVQAARCKGICDSEDRIRKLESRYFHQRFTRSNICNDKEVTMWFVSLHMRGSVTRNYIFSIIWRYYGQKQDILDYWGTITSCLSSYYILSKDKGL